MVEIVKDNLEKIVEACKVHQVKSLYLIGSGARQKDFSSSSDLDFLYQFKEGIPISIYADNYFELLEKLEQFLKRKIDLVPERQSRNNYFVNSIIANKVKLYEA